MYHGIIRKKTTQKTNPSIFMRVERYIPPQCHPTPQEMRHYLQIIMIINRFTGWHLCSLLQRSDFSRIVETPWPAQFSSFTKNVKQQPPPKKPRVSPTILQKHPPQTVCYTTKNPVNPGINNFQVQLCCTTSSFEKTNKQNSYHVKKTYLHIDRVIGLQPFIWEMVG